MDATTTITIRAQKHSLTQSSKVGIHSNLELSVNKTMPGLRIGLQTVAVSNGYDPSFQQHAKFGPVIKIKSKVVWITHALKIIYTTHCASS